jgi:hypothetical protein
VCACPLRRRWCFLSKEDYCTLAKKKTLLSPELAFEPIHILSEPMYFFSSSSSFSTPFSVIPDTFG